MSEPVEITVWSDFVCPFCFLAEEVLAQVAAERPVRVAWRAYELLPDGRTFDAAKAKMIEAGFPKLRAMAREHGVELPAKHPRIGVDTRLAHEASKFFAARLPDRQTDFQRAVFRAHWLEDAAIDDAEVLTRLAEKKGANPSEFREALDQHLHRDGVLDDERDAAGLGIRGVPAQRIAGRFLPAGFHPRPELQRAIDLISRQ